MRDLARIVVFIVAVVASAVCGLAAANVLENPYDDITRAWATLVAVVSAIIALSAWIGFVLLRPRCRTESYANESSEENVRQDV